MGNRNVHVSCEYEYDNFLGYLKVSVFPDRVFLLSIPDPDDFLLRLIASVCCFATAINQHEPGIEVSISSSFKVPLVFCRVISEYNNLQSDVRILFTNPDTTPESTSLGSKYNRIHRVVSRNSSDNRDRSHGRKRQPRIARDGGTASHRDKNRCDLATLISRSDQRAE